MSENKGSEYLAHYGILKMKWGVRRFQNEDGSLTEEGKARYSQGKEKKPNKKPESSTWKSSEAGSLSDAELNRRNSRLQRENQYKQLTRSRAQKAFDWIKSIAGTVLVATAVTAMKGKVGVAYKSGLSALGSKIAGSTTGLRAKYFIDKYKKMKLPTLSSLGLKG